MAFNKTGTVGRGEKNSESYGLGKRIEGGSGIKGLILSYKCFQ